MAEPDAAAPLIEAREVSKLFSARTGLYASGGRKYVRAVDRASLSVFPAEIVGLVGESGCGKSTLGRLLIRLETVSAGRIFLEGLDITHLKGRHLRHQRRRLQIIFQDPTSSLNPRYSARDTLVEAVRAHRPGLGRRDVAARLAALSDMVGLAADDLDRYPKELSSGQRQRVAIARTLAVEPRFIVADEPVSALDLAYQAQIAGLLEALRRELGVCLLLIAHDLDLVARLCNRVAVMYLGRIVESADAADLFAHPRHPYTRALMAATLSSDPRDRRPPIVLHGEPPSPLSPPPGCHFHPRCPHAEARCSVMEPDNREVAPQHFAQCHLDL